MQLEFFIHGALCVSYSGQCYLSHAVTGRSANRGECAQLCRLLHCRDHCRMGVTQYQWAPGEHVIDVAVAIHIEQVCACAFLDE